MTWFAYHLVAEADARRALISIGPLPMLYVVAGNVSSFRPGRLVVSMPKQLPLPVFAFSTAEQSFSRLTPRSGRWSTPARRATTTTGRRGETSRTRPFRLTTVRYTRVCAV